MSKIEEIKQKRNSGRGVWEAIEEDAKIAAEFNNKSDGNIAILQYDNNATPDVIEPAMAPEELPSAPRQKISGKMKAYLEKSSGLTLTTIRMPVEIHKELAQHKLDKGRRGDKIINELIALYLDIYKDSKLMKRVEDSDSFYDAVMYALKK